MRRAHNFSAGPATLPLEVLQQIQDEIIDFRGRGLSIVEASHRSSLYRELHEQTIDHARRLLGIAADWELLLLGGGATLQFAMVPLNLLSAPASFCDIIVSGAWAAKAAADAERVAQARIIFDGGDHAYSYLPGSVETHSDAVYLHLTSNETIHGLQWQQWPASGGLPLVIDMSSDIMSRPLSLEHCGLIYAGTQKNLGIAGLTVVAIRPDLLERCATDLPAYLSYATHAKSGSLYNTPPVFAVYVFGLMLNWLEAAGGPVEMQARSHRRAGLLYDVIDNSSGFFRCPVRADVRSCMNVIFRLPSAEMERRFLQEAAANDMIDLAGHRSVGGCRASLYNALPESSAAALADFMRDFAERNG